MVKETGGRLLGDFALDRGSEVPLHRQIYLQIRTHVLNGVLPGGARLPSTRTLTAELGVSRITIVNAFEELCAEGFLRSRAGDGTYVGEEWRSQFAAEPAPERPMLSARATATTSSRGSELSSHAPASWNPEDAESFVPSQVGVDAFPVRAWKRLLARHGERRDVDMLGYGDPFGHWPLREAIADYLHDARGITATAGQVVICSGAQQAFNALALLMVDSGDEVWMEDPGHIAARLAFLANGCTVRGIPIDAEGADLAAGAAMHQPGRLMFVTPSRQHPLGVSMSLARRMEWIKWANEQNSWLIEDDCDSELRYRGPLMPTLFGLDRSQHVIHVGTFSKIMFPSLRIGYAVLPTDLVEPFKAAVSVTGRTPPTLLQAVTTDFIREGHLHAHIRRTRRLYLARQNALLAALREQLHPFMRAEAVDAGMHVIGWLPESIDDQLLATQLADRGIYTYALGDYYLDGGGRPALLIGFAATAEDHMPQAVSHMVRALHHIGHRW